MKKLLLIVLALGVLILSSCTPKKENLTGEIIVPRPLIENTSNNTFNLTKLDASKDIVANDIHSLGFSRCIIESKGLRYDNNTFKTDFKAKRQLQKTTKLLEESDIAYYIEITSGPGISPDRKNLSLFTNKDNIVFFTQMVKETIDMNKDNPHFNGIILTLSSKDIQNDVYYKTLNKIVNRITNVYDTPITISLDSGFFTSKDPSLPLDYFDNPDISFNVNMDFRCDTYPGTATFNSVDIPLSKNQILEKLIDMKESYGNNSSRKLMFSLKCPWNEGSPILLKDLFEIMKIVKFEFSLSYSNSKNEYDFTNNKDIVDILNKY